MKGPMREDEKKGKTNLLFDSQHSSQNEKGHCYSFPKFLIIQDEKFN